MHSDLLERAQIARENIDVPVFPLASIRSAVQHVPKPSPRRRTIIASILAGLSVVAIATAAEVMQTHITLNPQGGMVVSSSGKQLSQPNPTDAEIRDAAAHLDFRATLPSGLPEGTIAKQLGTLGPSALYVRYDLPGAERRSHHLAWIFLANPKSITGQLKALDPQSQSVQFATNQAQQFRAGAEQVVVVSNGLTPAEFAAIKASMQQAAQ